MEKPWIRRFLRLAAFVPALFLGTWLVTYTQRQAARPPSVDFNYRLDQLILGARAEAAANAAADDGAVFRGDSGRGGYMAKGAEFESPYVVRVTSKRIEMPVFDTRKVTNSHPTVWDGDTVTAVMDDRKGIEPWLAGFMDRLSRNFGIESPTP